MAAIQYFVILNFNFPKINTKIIGNKLLFLLYAFNMVANMCYNSSNTETGYVFVTQGHAFPGCLSNEWNPEHDPDVY